MFALPVLGVIVVAGWLLFRPQVDDAPVPAKAAAPRAADDGAKRASRDAEGDAPTSDAKAPPAARPSAGAPPPQTVRDAKRSESIRIALRDRLRERGSDSPPERGDDETAEVGTLDKDYIKARIAEDLVPIAKECYESALEDDPKLAGKIVMQFGIAGDDEVGGVVDEASVDPSSTLTHPALGECMRESMMSLSFPAPEGGGRVAVTYPFEFSPDGPASK
jgi:hypothetical protein